MYGILDIYGWCYLGEVLEWEGGVRFIYGLFRWGFWFNGINYY